MSVALVAVLGTCLALAAPAMADKPEMAPSPFAESTGQYCDDFAVRIRATTDRGTIKVFSTGAALITGTLKVEVTNLESGRTIGLNISGPARFSSDGTTLVGTGAWLLFGEPGFFGPGSPRTLETSHGRLVINLEDGSIVSQIGHRVELCPALAG